MSLTINYCTRCDKDISHSTGNVCPQCQSTTHKIAIDVGEKCDHCGDAWIAHGNLMSASACRTKPGFFTPNAASPTLPRWHTGGTHSADNTLIDDKQEASQPCGMACSKCQDFNEYAISNTPSGQFICYSCKR
jgi:hypothetical protein